MNLIGFHRVSAYKIHSTMHWSSWGYNRSCGVTWCEIEFSVKLNCKESLLMMWSCLFKILSFIVLVTKFKVGKSLCRQTRLEMLFVLLTDANKHQILIRQGYRNPGLFNSCLICVFVLLN